MPFIENSCTFMFFYISMKTIWDMISFYELLKWTWCGKCGHKFGYFCSKLNKGGLRAPELLDLLDQKYLECFKVLSKILTVHVKMNRVDDGTWYVVVADCTCVFWV